MNNQIVLRDYQQDSLNKLLNVVDDYEGELAFGSVESDTIVIDAPVNYGKTVFMLYAASELAKRGEKVLIVMPIKALIEQFIATAKKMNISIGVIAAGMDELDSNSNIKIAMLQTLKNRVEDGHHNDFEECWIFQDEIHKFANTGTIISIKNKLRYKGRIGLTGTPFNAFGYALDNMYSLIKTITPKQLIANGAWHGNIITYVANFAEKIDFDKIKITSSGDFDQKMLNGIIEEDSYINSTIAAMDELSLQNNKILVFTSSIETGEKLNKALQARGYSSSVLHSKQKTKEREAILNSFITQEPHKDPNATQESLPEFNESKFIVKCVVNVGILSTGFSDDDVEGVVIATSIGSRSKFYQLCGRLVRQNENIDKKILLDCGSNIARFGFVDDDFEPVVRTGDKTKDKLALAAENDKWSLPLISEFLDDKSKVTEISRKDYETAEKRLKELEKQVFDEKQRNRTVEDIAKDVALVIRTTSDLQHLAEAYIWFWIYVNGKPISKAGNEYTPPANWFYEKWENDFAAYPEKNRHWMKALKTRAKNIIKNGKNINSLQFFTNFLREQYESELALQNDINGMDDFDIEDSEIPF